VRFGPWLPIEQAAALAPEQPGVLQARGDALLELPRGKSAMVLYAASAPGQSLRAFVAGPGAPLLATAASLGARWVRFADASAPEAQLARLLRLFEERFGAPPRAHAPTPSTQPRDDGRARPMPQEKPPEKQPLTYREAGVDIDAGDELVERIKPHVRRTMRPEVLGGLGGFAGMCALPAGYREPVLVGCTDGVGTKLKLAFLTGKHDTIGIDLVAMNVNDLCVSGAEPLFFLDYFASSKLDVDVAEQVIAGIAAGCREAGCALLGGETAELPGFYQAGEYDLAGFCVGVVERQTRIDGRSIAEGDVLLGLASSGFHSNGYSLVRKVFLERAGLDLNAVPEGLAEPLGQALLRPTRIYVRSLRKLHAAGLLKGAAHITGGGLIENPGRMLPSDAPLRLQIDSKSWTWPPLFQLLARLADLSTEEMRRTFNVGLGMIVCVSPERVAEATAVLEAEGETVHRVGRVAGAEAPGAPVEFLG
jgi:phosphoribosylformylglycinamidine cyclo-ligase